jgi:hypothetical protein
MENCGLASSWMHCRAAHAIMALKKLPQRCDPGSRAERAH